MDYQDKAWSTVIENWDEIKNQLDKRCHSGKITSSGRIVSVRRKKRPVKQQQIKKNGKCCFCKKPYTNYGNNAASGRCCDDCNLRVVIPQRLQIIDNKS